MLQMSKPLPESLQIPFIGNVPTMYEYQLYARRVVFGGLLLRYRKAAPAILTRKCDLES